MKKLIALSALAGLIGSTAATGEAAAKVGRFVTGKGKCEARACSKAKANVPVGAPSARVSGKAEGWAGAGAEAKSAKAGGAASMAAAVVPGGTILSAALSGAQKVPSSAKALKKPRHFPGPNWKAPKPKHFPGPNWKAPKPKHFPGPNWKAPKPKHFPGPNWKAPKPKHFPGPNWKGPAR